MGLVGQIDLRLPRWLYEPEKSGTSSFSQIDITFWALGDLRKIRIGAASANLRPNGVLQVSLEGGGGRNEFA
jgi:hypothetical protein